MPAPFYVYRIFDRFETIYVGKGSGHRLAAQKRRFRAEGEILERLDDEDAAFERERYWIATLHPTENKVTGGNGGRCSDNPIPRQYRGKISLREFEAVGREQRRLDALFEKIGTKGVAARIVLHALKVAPQLCGDLVGNVERISSLKTVAYPNA